MTRPAALILGGGINGSAIARELALQGFEIHLVDSHDLSYGATAYSSRLIHGGLRYLEYGEFDLVRESLAERARLLQLAPHLVRPLEFFIPAARRGGGVATSIARAIGLEKLARRLKPQPRGLWLLRLGLWFYDRYAGTSLLARHQVHSARDARLPQVDTTRYRWLCSYYDAQVLFPERFVVAQLVDAEQAARAAGGQLQVWTYHRAVRDGATIHIVPTHALHTTTPHAATSHTGTSHAATSHTPANATAAHSFSPDVIVNATGAWVDSALHELRIDTARLIGGTRGSHFITYHAALAATLAGRALYVEAPDGRPVFLLPLGSGPSQVSSETASQGNPASQGDLGPSQGRGVMVGTTDLPFDGDPASAVATEAELDYLLNVVNQTLGSIQLTRDDITWHYCGIRPLPNVNATSTSAITRRHWLEYHDDLPMPVYSVIGGKLTTCRSLAEEAVDAILARLQRPRLGDTRHRPLPGGEHYPADSESLATQWQAITSRHGLSLSQVAALWLLWGTQTEQIVAESCQSEPDRQSLAGVNLPRGAALWSIRHEWARTLGDLVERRLMLLYDAQLTQQTLADLAQLLVAESRLAPHEVETAIATTQARLAQHYGRQLPTTGN